MVGDLDPKVAFRMCWDPLESEVRVFGLLAQRGIGCLTFSGNEGKWQRWSLRKE